MQKKTYSVNILNPLVLLFKRMQVKNLTNSNSNPENQNFIYNFIAFF